MTNIYIKAFNFFLHTATTKILEMLFALNWLWYFFASLVPRKYIAGALLSYLDVTTGSVYGTIAILLTLAVVSHYALIKNILWLRKAVMFFNIGLCFLSAALALFGRFPPSAGAGFVLILGALSSVSIWKMTVNTTNQ